MSKAVFSPLFPYEELTAEQVQKMEQLAAEVEKIELCPGWSQSFATQRDVFLVKFLTSRKWVVADAMKMIVDSSKFRNENKLDTSPLFPSCIPCLGYDQEALEDFQGLGPRPTGTELDGIARQLRTCYAATWHKWDKDGRPVYYERTGAIRVKEMMARCRQMVPPGGDLARPCRLNHLHSNEVGAVLLRYQNSRRPEGAPAIVQCTVVMDCEGFTLSQLFGPAMEVLKEQTAMDAAYYPEGLHRLYVANAPTTLSIAWNIVKGWLDPRVQKKVVFLKPAETKAGLLEAIDAACLPASLGGTCECEGGCIGSTDTSADPSVEECGLVKTDHIEVAARSKATKVVKVDEGAEALWEHFVADKYDIDISVTFSPAAAGAAPIVVSAPGARTTHGSGSYTPSSPGELVFTFDNTYSWMAKKKVSFRVVTNQAAAEAIVAADVAAAEAAESS